MGRPNGEAQLHPCNPPKKVLLEWSCGVAWGLVVMFPWEGPPVADMLDKHLIHKILNKYTRTP